MRYHRKILYSLTLIHDSRCQCIFDKTLGYKNECKFRKSLKDVWDLNFFRLAAFKK